MAPAIEVSEDLLERIDDHRAEEETREEFLDELVHYYETQGASSWEGYGGPP